MDDDIDARRVSPVGRRGGRAARVDRRDDPSRRARGGPRDGLIERVAAADLAVLATEGAPPWHLGAVLVLKPGPGFDPAAAARLLAARARGVPRLGRRIVRVPPGCGGPVWVDDPGFDPERHVDVAACPAPGDDRALLDRAARVVEATLPPGRPWWRAVFLTGLAEGRVAVVLVVHHALADGIGGLAVLARLVDGASPAPLEPAGPLPPRRVLAVDALRARARALTRLGATWHELRRSFTAGGGLSPPRAADCSLLRPTGPRRILATARADLDAVRSAAHAHGGTVNDVLLTAVGGALRALLATRGETVEEFRIGVPVTARRSASVHELGNRIAPLLIGVPAAGTPAQRLSGIAGTVRAAREQATAPPPIAILQPLVRLLSSVGLYRGYLNHQHRLHTLVSDVPGPPAPLRLAGAPITSILPLAVGESGNMAVSFVALSYAGELAVTVVADPDGVPDLSVLAAALQRELDALTAEFTAPAPPRP